MAENTEKIYDFYIRITDDERVVSAFDKLYQESPAHSPVAGDDRKILKGDKTLLVSLSESPTFTTLSSQISSDILSGMDGFHRSSTDTDKIYEQNIVRYDSRYKAKSPKVMDVARVCTLNNEQGAPAIRVEMGRIYNGFDVQRSTMTQDMTNPFDNFIVHAKMNEKQLEKFFEYLHKSEFFKSVELHHESFVTKDAKESNEVFQKFEAFLKTEQHREFVAKSFENEFSSQFKTKEEIVDFMKYAGKEIVQLGVRSENVETIRAGKAFQTFGSQLGENPQATREDALKMLSLVAEKTQHTHGNVVEMVRDFKAERTMEVVMDKSKRDNGKFYSRV